MITAQNISILFVDDEENVLNSLRRFLSREEYKVHFANSGENALELMAKIPIQVIVTDQRMPEMDGLQLLDIVKKRYPETIRLMLSAIRDLQQVIEAVNSGEIYRFISKPLEPIQFRLTITDAVNHFLAQEERRRLLTELSLVNKELMTTHQELIQARQREKQWEHKIEKLLLQSKPPRNLNGAEIAAISIPSGHLDGDVLEFITYGTDCLDILVGDVMGKGVQSAMVTMGIKNFFLKAVGQKAGRDNFSRLPSLAEILQDVHHACIEELHTLEKFITLCYSRIDLARGKLEIIDCGHTKTIHYLAAKDECRYLEGPNMPLGIETEGAKFETIISKLAPGDRLLFYSDGVTEATNNTNKEFGREQLSKIVKNNCQNKAEKILDIIINKLRQYCGSESFNDDFSCVVIAINNQEH